MSEKFRLDIKSICDRLRTAAAGGPEAASPSEVVGVLQDVLRAERLCVARYRREYELATEVHGADAALSFMDYANEEQRHVDMVLVRIGELGATPDEPAPEVAEARTRRPVEAVRSSDGKATRPARLEDLVADDLAAERIIVDTYRRLTAWLAGSDDQSARMMDEILESEVGHVCE